MIDTELKLVTITEDESWRVDGSPFGIEKIDARDFVIFRLWANRRVYLRRDGFSSRAMALRYLEPMVSNYRNSIITAITEGDK